ncbi:cholecystokinin receptor type A-like [Acanthaster planci]|uniref:Cholecystokinin receptor type A-like n=1 Tax=Acanthaster planci TaxID=133434 RepID=A0A8B7Y0J5_ACAPL|nr:cholecystokinin receptor type A-like [Acanthaster planci]
MDSLATNGNVTVTDEPTSFGDVVLKIIYTIIGLLGIVGNSLVIYLVYRVPSLRSVTNVLICNQAIIDLTSSVFFVCLYLLPKPSLPESAVAASVLCKLWLSDWPLWGFSVSSTVNLVLLTMERYFAIKHPIKYRTRFTMRRAKALAVLPWCVGPLHELAWALVQTVDAEGNCDPSWPSVTLQQILGVIFFIDHYMLPVTIMMYVYTTIIMKLRRDWRSSSVSLPRTGHAQTTTNNSISSNNNDSKVISGAEGRSTSGRRQSTFRSAVLPPSRKHFSLLASKSVLRTLLIVSASYIVCWGPNETIYLLFNLGVSVEFNGLYHNMSVVFALCNMCLNPIVYAFHYEELKKALRKKLPCKTGWKARPRPCCCKKSKTFELGGLEQHLATVTSPHGSIQQL